MVIEQMHRRKFLLGVSRWVSRNCLGHFRRLAAALIIGACSTAISGCSEWPPHADELSLNYFENREEFMSVSGSFLKLEHSQVFRSNKPGGLRASIELEGRRSIEFISGEVESLVNEQFDRLGLVAAIKLDDSIQLEVPGILSGGRQYYVFYLYGRRADGAPICDRTLTSRVRGMCRTPLDGDWSLVYKW